MQIKKRERFIPYTETYYIAQDGKEFRTAESCLSYERDLENSKHPVMQSMIPNLEEFENGYDASLFYIRDKLDLIYLNQKIHMIVPFDCPEKCNKLRCKRYHYCPFTDFDKYGPGWYLCWVIPGGDSEDTYRLRNLEGYIQSMKISLSTWEGIISDSIRQKEKKNHENHAGQ